MQTNQHRITINLTPSQFTALSKLSQIENGSIESLVERGVDTFIAAYQANETDSTIEKKLDRMHDHLIKLFVSVLKLVGQTLYFSSLPLTTGPVKAKLNDEGISIQWHQSEKFASDLLRPPAPIDKSKIKTSN